MAAAMASLLGGFLVLFMVVFLAALFGFPTLTWPPRSEEERSANTGSPTLTWPTRSEEEEGSANTTSTTTELIQAGVTEEMVNAVVDSAFGSKDTDLAGETAARRPEAARAAHEDQEDPIAKGDDEEERTRRDKIEHDLLK